MTDDMKLPEPDLLFGTPADGSPLKDGYTAATVRRLIAEAKAEERGRLAAKFMADAQAAHERGNYTRRDELSTAAGFVLNDHCTARSKA